MQIMAAASLKAEVCVLVWGPKALQALSTDGAFVSGFHCTPPPPPLPISSGGLKVPDTLEGEEILQLVCCKANMVINVTDL